VHSLALTWRRSFFVHKFDISNNKASAIAGICYDVVLVLSPVTGLLIDAVGQRAIMSALDSSLIRHRASCCSNVSLL